MAVTPYWEIHIRPMFRLIDRDHMASFFDLFDYDAVSQNADDIVNELKRMPPQATGGLWPEEWIALFTRWRDAKCPRLTSAGGVRYTLAAKAPGMSLTGEGTYNAGDTAWFERLPDSGGTRVYALVIRPGGGGSPKPFKAEERSIPAGVKSVIVQDKDGSRTVNA